VVVLEDVTMATTQNWNRRGLAGPLCTIMIMAAIGLGALWLARPVSASEQPTVTAEAREEIQEAVAALRRVNQVRPIPQSVLDKALAVAVFDDLVKAAFIVGGTGGDGVLIRRTEGGWSQPAFVNLAGASVGAQIGGSRSDAVFLFMDQVALDALKQGRMEFGTAVTATAGPTTATADAATRSTRSHVLVYAKQEGLFAGASANGVKITLDDDLNRGVYGAAAADIMNATIDVPEPLGAIAKALKSLGKPGGSE
jgi:lipid-binding SYLF domain-containing protein